MFTDPSGEFWHLIIGAFVGGAMNWMMNGCQWNAEGLGYFAVGALAGALGAGVGAGIGSFMSGAGFMAGVSSSSAVTASGFYAGATMGAYGGFTSGLLVGVGNSLMQGNSMDVAIENGIKGGIIGGIGGMVSGGILGGLEASGRGRHFFTGEEPYFEATLDNYKFYYQDGPMDCKNASLESIEKLNGGTRTQVDFRNNGNKFMQDYYNKNGKHASLQEYFENAGFRVEDPSTWSHKSSEQYAQQIGKGMNKGYPTVIQKKLGNNGEAHTLTITKIRQWTPNSNVKVWFADPQKGLIGPYNWDKTIMNRSFTGGIYTFILK